MCSSEGNLGPPGLPGAKNDPSLQERLLVARHAEYWRAYVVLRASGVGVPQEYGLSGIVHVNGHFDRVVGIGVKSEMEDEICGRGITGTRARKLRVQRARHFQDCTDALGLPTGYPDASSWKNGDQEKEQNNY